MLCVTIAFIVIGISILTDSILLRTDKLTFLMKAQLCSLVRKLSQTVAIVNINEMYCRAPRVLLPCPTSPTTVPYKSYLRQNLKLPFHNIVIYLPTYTHCDMWLYLHNSVWTFLFHLFCFHLCHSIPVCTHDILF